MRRHYLPAALFLTVFATHLFGDMGCADSMWSIPTAVSLLDTGTPQLDRYLPVLEARRFAFTRQSGGHYYTLYPFATSLIAAPAVAVLRPLANATVRWAPRLTAALEATQSRRGCFPPDAEPIVHLHSWAEALIASAMVAATAVVILTIACNELSTGGALLVALIFAFCTSAWSTASRSLWQHGASMLTLAIALSAQVRAERSAMVGALLTVAYTIRPTNAVPLAAGTAWALLDRRARFIPFLTGVVAISILFVVATRHIYGTWLPPYFQPSYFGSNPFFAEALAGQLVSPARGLFVYSPVLFGSLAGVGIKIGQRRFASLDMALACTVVAHWVVISHIRMWWAGHSYGPRFFTDMLPYLVYFLIPFVGWLGSGRGFVRVIVAAAFTVSIAVSALMHSHGALSREAPYWNQQPIDIDIYQDRLWDWRRPPFLTGITFSPSRGRWDPNSVVCSAPPGPPSKISVLAITGSNVVLRWDPAPGHPTSYIVEAGAAPGLTNEGTRESWAIERPEYIAARVPPGKYFVRVRGKNRCGVGPPSEEISVTVP